MQILYHPAVAQGELIHVLLHLETSLPVTGNKLLIYAMLGSTPFLLRALSVRLVAIGMKKVTVIKRK